MTTLYARIPHLPGSRTSSLDRIHTLANAQQFTKNVPAGFQLVVEEKLDGSCVAISREPRTDANREKQTNVVARGRDGSAAALSRNEGRRLFATYVEDHQEIFAELLAPGDVVVGEWMALVHGVRYKLRHEPFVVLDLFRNGVAMNRTIVDIFAHRAGLARPAVLHQGGAIDVSEALCLLGTFGKHGASNAAEGVVYRLEGHGQKPRLAKVVHGDKLDGGLLPEATGLPAEWNWTHAMFLRANHEIHLTLDESTNVSALRIRCAELGVKCLVIENSSGATRRQPMTSSTLFGTRAEAVLAAARLALDLDRVGLVVVRTKIERDANVEICHPGDSYFEFHVRIALGASEEHALQALRRSLGEVGGHLSVNANSLRPNERFVTSRFWVESLAEAIESHGKVLNALTQMQIDVLSVEAERTVFDSNLAIDSGWAEPISASSSLR
jgi:RNA ligase